MTYIGAEPDAAFTTTAKQTITGTGVATYTLDHAVSSESDIRVYVDNVHQEGGTGKAYTVDGNQITFTENITSSMDCYVIFSAMALQTTAPAADSISTGMIKDAAVTNAKIDTMAASKLTGALPAISGASLTGIAPVTYFAEVTPSSTGQVDFTNIPSGVNRIYWTGWKVSGSASAVMGMRIGDSGGIETTQYYRQDHYASTSSSVNGASNFSSSGWTNNSWTAASNIITHYGELIHAGSNRWICNVKAWPDSASNYIIWWGGTKTLTGELDRVRFYFESGNFDGGTFRLGYSK